jgi:SAM-dependent methyltransferase
MNHEVIKTFFDAWDVYGEVLERDYMFHNELFAEVGRTVGELFGDAPFSVMDLGCGSARHISNALQGRNVSRYIGYDLSNVALAHARENLATLNCVIELRRADLFAGLDDGSGRVDLIFSSFAVHHLQGADKELFFRRALRRLTQNGRLLMIDIAREEGESREAWLERYCGWMEKDWTGLPPQALELACGHIRENDYPESSETLHRMAGEAGFGVVKDVCRFGAHQEWLFAKGSKK